jgi:glycosyltransferase involved in cell wall biosynthesis
MTVNRPVWLDVARLLERACVGSLTGIDRVELAYAEHLIAVAPERTRFVMMNRWPGRLCLLPQSATVTFIERLRQAWSEGRPDECRTAAIVLMARASVAPAVKRDARAVYLVVSHRHLDRGWALRRALHATGATLVPLIHDLIPLEFPEYARSGEATRHRRRIETVALLAGGIVVNSAATRTALAPYLATDRAIHVAPLGVSLPAGDIGSEPGDRPYFLCVGTIEPRKNHLLLLQIWRRLVAVHGDRVPRLLIVGQRGWENQNVLHLLDRCVSLHGHVVELGTVPDSQLTALLRGARALLMPSFAEGFGLPVAEALAHGTPVLCSDLPALREAGGGVPEYVDPLDAPAWTAAILEYAAEISPRRNAQMARLPAWGRPSWEAHVGSVLEFAEGLRPRMPGLAPASGRPLSSRGRFAQA